MEFLKLLTCYDKILIIFIILLSVLVIFVYPAIFTRELSEEKYVVVKIDSKEIYRSRLDGSKRTEKFSFKVEGKEYISKLEVAGERVRLQRLAEEIVPLSIHADTGWIDKSYQVIVALPIKLTVQIETENKVKPELDGVAY